MVKSKIDAGADAGTSDAIDNSATRVFGTILYDDGRAPLVPGTPTNDLSHPSPSPTNSQDLITVIRAAVTWFDQTVTDPVTSGQPRWVFQALALGIQPVPVESTVTVLLGPDDAVVSETVRPYDAHLSWGIGTAKKDVSGDLTLIASVRKYDEKRMA